MQKKKGISLIVLVITIIVMVILAGAIVLTLNNSGIINKAQDAVNATNEATVNELATLAWAEAYAEGVRTVEDLADGTKGLKTRIEEALVENNINPDDYVINVTTGGVTVKEGWKIVGSTVVKKDQVLNIGDKVIYDETAGGTKTVGKDVDWQVWGADAEGNLLIVSEQKVKDNHEFTGTIVDGKNDWINAASILNDICKPYGYGKSVVGEARSITMDDIANIVGYEKTEYGKGTIAEYGNIVTYSWTEEDEFGYTYVESIGSNGKTGYGLNFYNSFTWYNEETKSFVNTAKGQPLPTVKNTYYTPDVTGLSSSNPKVYETIFGTLGEDLLWTSNCYLASPMVSAANDLIYYIPTIYDGSLNNAGGGEFVNSQYGAVPKLTAFGVRAVVTLSSDIVVSGSSETGWSY